MVFFFSSRRRHTRCALVTGVQTCALPISQFSLIGLYQRDTSASSQQFLPLVSTILAPSDARRIDNRTFLGDPDYDTLKQRTASVTLIADHQFSEAVSISGRARYIDAKATDRKSVV